MVDGCKNAANGKAPERSAPNVPGLWFPTNGDPRLLVILILLVEDDARGRIQEQWTGQVLRVEVEHTIDGSGNGVERNLA